MDQQVLVRILNGLADLQEQPQAFVASEISGGRIK